MSFTIFVILPSDDVCSLRRLPCLSSIRVVRKMLEVSAGLPAQTYDLACPDGRFWADDSLLELDKNVWDGYVVRVILREKWQELYEAVLANEENDVLERALCKEGECGKVKDVTMEKGVAALFMASFLGLSDLCKALLGVGVNPDGNTPFGRTPLFAAMAADLHVTEVLLSHHASLEARDVDGASALDIAQEQQARQCLRKVRHLKLFCRTGSAASSRASGRSTQGSDISKASKMPTHVITIPTGIAADTEASNDTTEAQPTNNDCPPSKISDSSSKGQESCFINGYPKTSEAPTHASKTSPRTLFQHRELYTWENNLRSMSRASSAAGTHARIPVPGSGRERVSSGRNGRVSVNGTGLSDAVSVNSVGGGGSRRLSVKLSVQDLSISGLSPALKVSRPASPPHPNHLTDRKPSTFANDERNPDANLETSSQPFPDTKEANELDIFSKGPPERPPSPVEHVQTSREEGGNPVTAGSIQIIVPDLKHTGRSDCGEMPENTRQRIGGGERGEVREEAARDYQSSTADSSVTRHGKSRRKQEASWRTMKRRLKLAEDQKRKSTPRTTNKQSNNNSSNNNNNNNNNNNKESAKTTFEQWLRKKRKEKERVSSESDSSSSSESVDDEERSAENERAFKDWLRELKERPLRAPHPFTVASLHRRKSRPLKNLIQIGKTEVRVSPPDPDSYMTAYQQWRHAKTTTTTSSATGGPDTPLTTPQDLKKAKKQMEAKRRALLAEALTYEDWMEHSEEQQKLMRALLRANSKKAAQQDLHDEATLHHHAAPRQISFHEWRESVQRRREAETRHGDDTNKQQRMRREGKGGPSTEPPKLDKNGFVIRDDIRSSAAIPHQEWLRRKKEGKNNNPHNTKAVSEGSSNRAKPTVPARNQDTMQIETQGESGKWVVNGDRGGGGGGSAVAVSEDGKESAWEMWLQRKHRSEMERMSRSKGKQHSLTAQQKNTSRVT